MNFTRITPSKLLLLSLRAGSKFGFALPSFPSFAREVNKGGGGVGRGLWTSRSFYSRFPPPPQWLQPSRAISFAKCHAIWRNLSQTLPLPAALRIPLPTLSSPASHTPSALTVLSSRPLSPSTYRQLTPLRSTYWQRIKKLWGTERFKARFISQGLFLNRLKIYSVYHF